MLMLKHRCYERRLDPPHSVHLRRLALDLEWRLHPPQRVLVLLHSLRIEMPKGILRGWGHLMTECLPDDR